MTRAFRAGETVEDYCRACKSIASTRSSSSTASAARSACPATTAKVSTTSGADAAGTNAVDAELEHLESEARFGDEAVRVVYPLWLLLARAAGARRQSTAVRRLQLIVVEGDACAR